MTNPEPQRPSFAIPVRPDGSLDHRWGKAARVAVAQTDAAGSITSWDEYDVGWDVAHDAGPEGAHHARVVKFLREHAVTHVVVDHMGPPMQRTLAELRISILPAQAPISRDAVELAARTL